MILRLILLCYLWLSALQTLVEGFSTSVNSFRFGPNLCKKPSLFSSQRCRVISLAKQSQTDKNDGNSNRTAESTEVGRLMEVESQNIPKDNNSRLTAKLKAEASSPFRLFRQYLLVGGAIAGGLGTVTTLPQLIKAASVEDRNTALVNVAIDTTALVIGGFLWKYDTDQGKKKIDQFEAIQKKINNKLSEEEAAQREFLLGCLPIEIQTNERNENSTSIIPLSDLFKKGQQCVVIVAGNFDFVRDAIIAARSIGPSLFSDRDAFVVPFVVDEVDKLVVQQPDDQSDSKGFGTSNKSKLLSAPYFAKPKQLDIWQRILESEFSLAEAQGSKRVRSKGLVIAMNRDGRVVRRGLGQPPWNEVIGSISSRSSKNGT